MTRDRHFRIDALHLFVLGGFALAQPLYDLLGRNPEFFMAHRAGRTAIVALVLTLSIGIPALLALVEAAAALDGPRVRRHAHTLLVAALGTLIVLPPLGRVDGLAAVSVIWLALAAGSVFAFAYRRLAPLPSLCTLLAPSILLFPALFLFVTPIRNLVLPRSAPAPAAAHGPAPARIVLVVFDELTTSALLDERGEIDSVRFPNFAALARQAWWFPAAATVHHETVGSVGAVLTGRYPDPSRLTTMAQDPENLFRWLGSSYRLNVIEPVTWMCPPDLCADDLFAFRARRFAADVLTVYAHLVLPEEYALRHLPPLTAGWRDFGRAGPQPSGPAADAGADPSQGWFVPGMELGRHRQVERFLDRIRRHDQDQGTLDFLHVLLPHRPFEYLPSGRVYMAAPGWEGWLPDGRGVPESEVLFTVYQQYLLQIGFVDRLLGRLVDRLKRLALWDDTLLVVTADHGLAFRPGAPNRRPEFNDPEIFSVPMFVKLPRQRQGMVSDRLVRTIDVLPTIADAIGDGAPWTMDGHSMVGPSFPERGVLEVPVTGSAGVIRVDASQWPKRAPDDGRRDRFGTRTPLEGLRLTGPHDHLVGRTLGELPVAGDAAGVRVVSEMFQAFRSVDLRSGVLPLLLRGHVRTETGEPAMDLAIAVNGVLRLTTRTRRHSAEVGSFVAMLPKSVLRDGRNDVQVFAIEDTGSAIRLFRIPSRLAVGLRLERNDAGAERIVADDGTVISLASPAAAGFLDRVDEDPFQEAFLLHGWAVDVARKRPAESVLVFAGDRLILSGLPRLPRPDVAAHFAEPLMEDSGFGLMLPAARLSGRSGPVRLFALSADGSAAELRIHHESESLLRRLISGH